MTKEIPKRLRHLITAGAITASTLIGAGDLLLPDTSESGVIFELESNNWNVEFNLSSRIGLSTRNKVYGNLKEGSFNIFSVQSIPSGCDMNPPHNILIYYTQSKVYTLFENPKSSFTDLKSVASMYFVSEEYDSRRQRLLCNFLASKPPIPNDSLKLII